MQYLEDLSLSVFFFLFFVRTSSPSDTSAQPDFIYFTYTNYNGILYTRFLNRLSSDVCMYVCIQEQEQELYLPRHRLVEVEAILPLTLQTNLILLAVGQF